MEFQYELKIPKDRVAVLIGKRGITKRQIETATSCKLDIDSKEGDIIITGEDGLHLFTAKEIILTISRGFNPEIGMLLLKQDYSKEILSLSDYARSKKDLDRIRGRVIGKEGKSRHLLEEFTESHVCVYGKTICIVGESQKISICRKAVEALLQGSPHNNVWKWLEKKRRELKRQQFQQKAF